MTNKQFLVMRCKGKQLTIYKEKKSVHSSNNKKHTLYMCSRLAVKKTTAQT